MGYATKVQLIERIGSKQFYISIPSALADAIELRKGERVEWIVHDKLSLVLKRGKGRRQKCRE